MNWKKPLWMLLIVTLILSMTMISVDADPQPPKLFVDPPKHTATQLGENFTIDINITNVQDLKGFDLKLGYNTTLLDALDAVVGPFPRPLSWAATEIHEPEGYVLVSVISINPADGNGTLAAITFNVTYAGSASCTLDLYDTTLYDSNADPITHEVEDGNYQFAILSITVATDKLAYTPGENVQIHGNLTLAGSPHQGLMALEVDDPGNYGIIRRTLQIGPEPPPGNITITDVIPCDMWGQPKENFSRGTLAYFKVTVGNTGTEWKEVAVTVNAYDGDTVTLGAPTSYTTIGPGVSNFTACIDIQSWAYIGTGTAYANVFTDLPRAGGVPLCSEKSANFTITGSSGGAASLETQNSGNYTLTFKLAPNATAGVYRVYASARYLKQYVMGNTVFGVNVIMVPNDYPTIQEAVDAATPTINAILVSPETYNETVTINKSLTLVGVDPNNTIINGSGTGTVVTVTADNVEISRFIIQNSGSSFPNSGIALSNSSGSTISENTIFENYYGVYINSFSQGNIIRGNTIASNNGYGIMIDSSDNNDILDNTLSSNNYGVYINHSSSTTLRNNEMICNKYNFGVFGDSLSDFIHNIYTSNTVDGKPIYYLIGQQDGEVPSNAGFVAIIDSREIVVRGLDLTKNAQGVLLAFATDSLIERVNTINNDYGIYMVNSHNNTIIGGTVSNNSDGIYQRYSNENIICHNNFTDNINQVELYQSLNTWNDDAGKGNYWSDYNGTDLDDPPDGVGDEYLPWQGVDFYPLIDPWTLMHDIAVVSVTPVPPYNVTEAFPGWVVYVKVTFKNEGDFTETFFNITAYWDGNSIEMKTVTELIPQAETAINFTWDTTGLTPCRNYTTSANISSVIQGEEDTGDNLLEDGKIYMRLIGDVNGNGIVMSDDIIVVQKKENYAQTTPANPYADVNCNGFVGSDDIIIIQKIENYAQTCP